MLHYLDNSLSVKGALNENYARELLELHTLGVDGGYTQDDVINVARAFTGWTVVTSGDRMTERTSSFTFKGGQHDEAEKLVLGHRLASGRGIADGEQVLDIVARHPSTARYISWKLARRFVSDSPPPALVDRAALVFLQTDGDISSVVRTIVTSDEFFADAAFRAKVKNPLEFIVSARRALGARADSTSTSWRAVCDLGQPMFGRASPDGWPDDGAAWINSGTILNRIMYAADLAADKVPGVTLAAWPGWSLVDSTAREQADGVIRLVLGGVATDDTRRTLADINHEDGEERLREMVAVVLGSPEFQRR
jgi:uncharacterized protein (DUF1800 family)